MTQYYATQVNHSHHDDSTSYLSAGEQPNSGEVTKPTEQQTPKTQKKTVASPSSTIQYSPAAFRIEGLDLTADEELAKWLGRESSVYVKRIRYVHINNPKIAL